MAGALLLAAASAGCRAAPSSAPNAGPDVVLIVADTLRADRLGPYGGPPENSPFLDRLARNAVVYEQATATAPLTMPSMAAILTGRLGDRVGVWNHAREHALDDEATTLAELLATRGYQTAAVITNPWLARERSGFHAGLVRVETKTAPRMHAAEVVDSALAIVRDADREKPLFLWAHFMDTHMPYEPPAASRRAVGAREKPNGIIDRFKQSPESRQGILFNGTGLSEDDVADTASLYDAAVHYVDAEIGRLLAAMDDTRDRERVVVFLSDHGEALGEHGLYFGHDFTLYQELVHVPLLLAGPGIEPARVAVPVSTLDVLPTLCRMVSLPCDDALDGRPLPKAGAPTERDRFVFAAGPPFRGRYELDPFTKKRGVDGRWTAVRRGDLKLISVPTEYGMERRAYDLANDPAETTNVFSESKHPAWIAHDDRVRARLRDARTVFADRKRANTPKLDAQTRDALKALGYME